MTKAEKEAVLVKIEHALEDLRRFVYDQRHDRGRCDDVYEACSVAYVIERAIDELREPESDE